MEKEIQNDRKERKRGIYSLIFIFGVFSALFFLSLKESLYQNNLNQDLYQGGYKLISPLVMCADSDKSSVRNIPDLKGKILGIINKSKEEGGVDTVSIYYRDLLNGPIFSINEKETFSPASILKLLTVIDILKRAEIDGEILTEEFLINVENDLFTQQFNPEKALTKGESYTLIEIIEASIIYSDNNAQYFLEEEIALKGEIFKNLLESFDIDVPSFAEENTMTILDVSSIFRILFNATYLNPEMSEKLLEILTRSKFKIGIAAGVPEEILVANKFGEREYMDDKNSKQLHDCGIIYHERPYLLCVMTRGSDYDKLVKVIREISEIIYDHKNGAQ